MRWLAVFVGVAACRGGSPARVDAGTVATAAPAIVSASASASASATPAAADPTIAARVVLKKWNDAHNAHDASALEALYAKKVRFYGAELSAAECAKRKAAAFAKAPDYAQRVHLASVEPEGDGFRVHFVKTSASKGKPTNFPSFLMIVDGRITEESDKVTDDNLAAAQQKADEWCFDPGYMPNGVVRPPFTISAQRVWSEVWATKHVEALEKRLPQLGIDAPTSCPQVCGATPDTCGLAFRLVDLANLGVTTSIMVEWVYIDAVKNVMWFEDVAPDGGLAWKSEQLVWTAPKD